MTQPSKQPSPTWTYSYNSQACRRPIIQCSIIISAIYNGVCMISRSSDRNRWIRAIQLQDKQRMHNPPTHWRNYHIWNVHTHIENVDMAVNVYGKACIQPRRGSKLLSQSIYWIPKWNLLVSLIIYKKYIYNLLFFKIYFPICFSSEPSTGETIQWIIHDTRWFKYDRDWFVCKQAALRSSCATLREWSHNLHPPSFSG